MINLRYFMWYVRDEFTNKIYFKSYDVRKTQNFANFYNHHFKFSSQRMFRFNIYDFTSFSFFIEDKIDVCGFTKHYEFFNECKYIHPLAIKSFHKRPILYLEKKLALIRKLCKKYHLWSYNSDGRKCDGFDF